MIRKFGDVPDDLRVTCGGIDHIETTVALRPGKYSLDLEPLALTIFVVSRDPLSRLCLYVVDAKYVSNGMNAAHRRIAGVTSFGFVIAMSGTALIAD